MADDQALTDWQELRSSPGWSRLLAKVAEEWEGPVFTRNVEQLADNPTDATALSKLRQMMAAKRAVQALVKFPSEEIRRLKGLPVQDPDAPANRRGRL